MIVRRYCVRVTIWLSLSLLEAIFHKRLGWSEYIIWLLLASQNKSEEFIWDVFRSAVYVYWVLGFTRRRGSFMPRLHTTTTTTCPLPKPSCCSMEPMQMIHDTLDPTCVGLLAASNFLRTVQYSDLLIISHWNKYDVPPDMCVNLPNWNHAALPCLRSRLALGVRATTRHTSCTRFNRAVYNAFVAVASWSDDLYASEIIGQESSSNSIVVLPAHC